MDILLILKCIVCKSNSGFLPFNSEITRLGYLTGNIVFDQKCKWQLTGSNSWHLVHLVVDIPTLPVIIVSYAYIVPTQKMPTTCNIQTSTLLH